MRLSASNKTNPAGLGSQKLPDDKGGIGTQFRPGASGLHGVILPGSLILYQLGKRGVHRLDGTNNAAPRQTGQLLESRTKRSFKGFQQNNSLLLGQPEQLFRLLPGKGKRLLAQYMLPPQQGLPGHFIMEMMGDGNINGMNPVQKLFVFRIIFQQSVGLCKTADFLLIPSENGCYFNIADIFGLPEKTARYTSVTCNSHIYNGIPGGTEVC